MGMQYTLLLYDTDPRDIKSITYEASQLGMSVTLADTLDQALSAMKRTFFELAILNTALPRVTLPKDTKIITIGDPSQTALFEDELYQRKMHIVKPLPNYMIRYALICVSGIFAQSYSYPANIVRILAMLRESLYVFDCLSANPNMFLPLRDLGNQYCVQNCVFGVPPHEVTSAMADYTPVSLVSSRGTVVCKFFHTCMLHRFADFLSAEKKELYQLSVFNPISETLPDTDNFSFLNLLSQLNDRYLSIIKEIIDNKESFCQANCYTLDESSREYQKKKRHLCCEYGCVMDNYFDVSPLPQKGKKYSGKTLLYIADGSELKILRHYCVELGLDVFVTDDPNEAESLCQEHDFDLAIVDYELEKIKIPARVNRIVIGKPTIAATSSIMSYLPVCFIPTPFELVRVALGVLKALGNYYDQQTVMALLQNISIYLESFHMNINNMITDVKNKMNFYDSCMTFCEHSCQFARKRSDLKDSELNSYYAIHGDIRKSQIFCKYRKECTLWAYMEWVKKENSIIDLASPSAFLQTLSLQKKGGVYREWLNAIVIELDGFLETLLKTKVTYCTEVCPKRKSDLNFEKKDNVLDPFHNILREGNCSYCRYTECPQNHFYEYFIQTIL
jgi:CheY-like chemotaxis protein